MWQSPWDNAVRGGDQVAQGDLGDRHRRMVRHGPGTRRSRAISRPATPISCSPRSAKSSAASGSSPSWSRCYVLIACARPADRAYARQPTTGSSWPSRVTLFLALPVLDDGGRRARADAADRRRHAVSQLRRIGDGGELRRRWACSSPSARTSRRSADTDAVPQAGGWPRRGAGRCGRRRASASCVDVGGRQRRRPRDASASQPAGRWCAALPIQPARARRRAQHPARHDLRSRRPAAGHRRCAISPNARDRRTRSTTSRSMRPATHQSSVAIRSAARLSICSADATSRLNWSAPNTSYVERDADARLRGFDDRATSVSLTDAHGQTHAAVRRDYRELLPLLRHRHRARSPGRARVPRASARSSADRSTRVCSRAWQPSSRSTRRSRRRAGRRRS